MQLRWIRFLAAAAVACAHAAVDARQAGPIVQVGFANGQATMRDSQSGQLLMDARGVRLYRSEGTKSLVPQVTFVPRPAGFDAVFTFTNTTAQPQTIGEFAAAVLTLGPDITWWDFRELSTPQIAHAGPTMYHRGYWYPGDLYSPVAVLSNDTHAVGVSLQYPVLHYKHDVLVSTCTLPGAYAAGEGGMGWMVSFRPSGYERGPSSVRACYVPPGAQRVYTMSVRVTRNPSEWVRTLLPYRHFFRQTYGHVAYERWAAPWVGLGLADEAFIGGGNPSGWAYTLRRPDVHGWEPWLDNIRWGQGPYKHFILWTPSGLYDQNRENNYPFQFTSRWLAHPLVKQAIDPALGLPLVRQSGRVLGLWWGRSLQVAPQWNAATLDPFDVGAAAHRLAGYRELDLAVAAGTEVIGLDTFDPTLAPIWDQVAWLGLMRARAPGMKFITEPSSCDILHRVAPTLVDGWLEPAAPLSPEDLYSIHHPNYLADFLLPGHETWATLRWDGWQTYFGHGPTAARMRQDVIKVAACGYVPVLFGQVAAPTQEFRAKRTWETTVPADLRP